MRLLNLLPGLTSVLLLTGAGAGPATENGTVTISESIVVKASAAEAWQAIARFSEVGDFHAGILRSASINGKKQGPGAERVCHYRNNRVMKDRVTRWQAGQQYVYETFAWENIPLEFADHTLGVRTNDKGQTELFQTTRYRMDSGIKTMLAKGQVRSQVEHLLLGYRYYIETGQRSKNMGQVLAHFGQ